MLTALFVTSSVILLIFDRFSHPTLPAYIIAGVIIGRFFPSDQIIGFTQIGIAFLVFIFGVKMDPERLKTIANDGIKTAAIQVTIISGISLIISYILGLGNLETLIFTLATSLSSTLVGLDLVEEELNLKLAHGRLAESIHLSQDIIAVLSLMIVSAPALTLAAVSQNILLGLTLLVTALLFRSHGIDLLSRMTENSRELMTLLSLSILISFLAIAEYFQLSLAIGGFAAGLAVSKYPHNMEILDTTGSLKDFFSAIFFVSLGALLKIPTIEVIAISTTMLLLITVIKPFIVIESLVGLGQNKRTAYLTGFSIDQVSELALTITIQAFLANNIGTPLFQSIIITATLSMIISSYTTKHGDKIYDVMSKYDRIEAFPKESRGNTPKHPMENHVVVIGYDTQGKAIVDKLRQEKKEFIVIENDPEKVTDLEEKNENFVYGDVFEKETWTRTNAKQAELIISTIPVERVSMTVLDIETNADIILRSENQKSASKLLEEGAIYVNIPDMLSSKVLTDHIEGLMNNKRYREDLRRRSMLELRRFIEDREG